LAREAREILRTGVGENHPAYLENLRSIGTLYHALGEHAAAEAALRERVEALGRACDEDHPVLVPALCALAEVYRDRGNGPEAERSYRQALAIARKVTGNNDTPLVEILSGLATLHLTQGQYDLAEPFLRQTLEIDRRAHWENSLHHTARLHRLAGLCAATGREAEALTLMDQATAVEDRLIPLLVAVISPRDSDTWLHRLQDDYWRYLSLVVRHFVNSPEAAQATYELVLRRKARGVEWQAAPRDDLLEEKYSGLALPLRELAILERQIALKTLAGPGAGEYPAYREALAEWTTRRDRLRAELIPQVPELDGQSGLPAGERFTDAVAAAIPGGAALVEFVRFEEVDVMKPRVRGKTAHQAARYLAFALPACRPDQICLLDLGETSPVDQLVATLRACWSRPGDGAGSWTGSDQAGNIGRALRVAVFDPVVAALPSARGLLVAPDGELAHLPFWVLPGEDGRALGDHYAFDRIRTGRDLLARGKERGGSRAPGDP
jgi:tetratricopeptide (TPR) repeat protein